MREFEPSAADERDAFSRLLRESALVPFVGAGFSMPLCPSWIAFLKDSFAFAHPTPAQRAAFQAALTALPFEPEACAQALFEALPGQHRERALADAFDKPATPAIARKLDLLRRAFPGCKLTTNIDRLLETGAAPHIDVIRCNEPASLAHFLDTNRNALFKLHGCISSPATLVFSRDQYAALYGHPDTFDPTAPLPALLIRLAKNHSLLFIGCSLVQDRVLKLLTSLGDEQRTHYALLHRDAFAGDAAAEARQRLAQARIQPIWLDDFEQIEPILARLAERHAPPKPTPEWHRRELFAGRSALLKRLLAAFKRGGQAFQLVGAGGVGKTQLALKAARLGLNFFPDGIFEILVGSRPPAEIAMELSQKLGQQVQEVTTPDQALDLIHTLCKPRQLLLILDNVEKSEHLLHLLPGVGAGCVLVTTRNRDGLQQLNQLRHELALQEFQLNPFEPKETLELFRLALGTNYREQEQDQYLAIATQLGGLPLALRLALNLMLFPPRWSARELQQKLRGSLQALEQGASKVPGMRTLEQVFLLAQEWFPSKAHEWMLLQLACCAEGPVPLDLLEAAWERQPEAQPEAPQGQKADARMLLEELHSLSWCERHTDDFGPSYELHVLVRELFARQVPATMRAHLHEILDSLANDMQDWQRRERWLNQLKDTAKSLTQAKDPRVKQWVYTMQEFSEQRGHGAWFQELCEQLEGAYPEDKHFVAACFAHRALILQAWGRLKEAFQLLQKAEARFEALGNRTGLASCYGNQALILQAWGRLEEAFQLHQKEEALKEALRNRAGLASCYSNQAQILQDRGRLKEAIQLLQKAEALFEKLDNRAGLATCYGNQALILQAWGRLEEAFQLHHKAEALEDELGNRAGLATCYGNQALILEALGQREEAFQMLQKAEALFEALDNHAGMANCYGNQARILQALDRLEETFQLHQKAVALFEALGNRAGLAICWWNLGNLHWDQGNAALGLALMKRAMATWRELKMPHPEQEAHLAERQKEWALRK